MSIFRPLHDRVLVRRIEAQEKTPGGIIIPDTAKQKPVEGEVIAAGPGSRGKMEGCIRSMFERATGCCSANGRELRC